MEILIYAWQADIKEDTHLVLADYLTHQHSIVPENIKPAENGVTTVLNKRDWRKGVNAMVCIHYFYAAS